MVAFFLTASIELLSFFLFFPFWLFRAFENAKGTRKTDYEKMNTVYAGYFPPGKRPARTCVGVTALARGARVEIDFIARRPATAPAKARSVRKLGRARS